LKPKQILPLLAALVLLSFALGSLPRSQPAGSSLLLGSYWLLYVLDFLPVVALGLTLIMLVYMIYNAHALSDALGFGIARKRRQQKKKSRTIGFIIYLATWTLAAVVLIDKCGGIFCQPTRSSSSLQQKLGQYVSGSSSGQALPLFDVAGRLSSLVEPFWFYLVFLGFLGVSAVILARALFVSLAETKTSIISQLVKVPEEGVAAVQDAIRIMETKNQTDPRTKIIVCYQRMMRAVQQLGTPITSDQTARELERAIRKILLLKGPAVGELTELFEEARYSLHPITERDAESAHLLLLSIAEEMNIQPRVLA
jgi:uncharacterized protein DUF4129